MVLDILNSVRDIDQDPTQVFVCVIEAATRAASRSLPNVTEQGQASLVSVLVPLVDMMAQFLPGMSDDETEMLADVMCDALRAKAGLRTMDF